MSGWRQMPKPMFYRIVEVSYRDGIGARRLSRLLGYSYAHIRMAARNMDLPRLPRRDRDTRPSPELLMLIASVEHFRLYKRERAMSNMDSGAGVVRPEFDEAA